MRNLDLGIRRGEVFGLLGPNGAGKTSAIHMMIGFLEPTAGARGAGCRVQYALQLGGQRSPARISWGAKFQAYSTMSTDTAPATAVRQTMRFCLGAVQCAARHPSCVLQ